MEITDISPASLPADWLSILSAELTSPYFTDLCTQINKEYASCTVFPPKHLLFNAFHLTHPDKVKVVILGQDPYHGEGEAHGLAFSVPDGIKTPPSLRNIFKEIQSEFPDSATPESGNLTRWAKQGVLLLNTVLTVRKDSARSHAGLGWELFTDAVIKAISDNSEGVVFMLWGKDAAAKQSLINRDRHLVLSAPHPSPLSAYRGFFGCMNFAEANTYLERQGKSPIVW